MYKRKFEVKVLTNEFETIIFLEDTEEQALEAMDELLYLCVGTEMTRESWMGFFKRIYLEVTCI